MTDERPWQRDNWDEYEELRGWSSGHLYLEAVDEFAARVWREAQADDYTRSTWAASKRAAAERTRADAAEAQRDRLAAALRKSRAHHLRDDGVHSPCVPGDCTLLEEVDAALALARQVEEA